MYVMKYGTIKFFNNAQGKMFGFIVPDDGSEEIFFHFNTLRGVRANLDEYLPDLIWFRDIREPRMGDRIVYVDEGAPNGNGRRAKVVAYEDTYESQLHAAVYPRPGSRDGAVTPEEMMDVLGKTGMAELACMAAGTLGLTNAQVGIFIRNTPGGKKSDELLDEFMRRNADTGDGYNFCTFMREVLAEAGHPYTIPAQ